MVSLSDSLVSSSARKLPIKVRPDLIARRQLYLGRVYWVIKDPIGSRYVRLQEEEYAILMMFDGTRSLDDVKDAFEDQFPPQKITLDELQHFLGQLHQNGLIVAATPNQGPELLKRSRKRKRQELFQKFTNILAIKFKGFDPDGIFTALMPFARPLFHPLVITFCLVLCLTALSLVLVNFDTFRSKLPEFQRFFSPLNLIFLSLTLGATKVLHEFGHGLTAKYFKGECHEMGIMFLVLTPCLYVNVSDSWLLPNKWHRIAIAVAGVYVECVLAAICTFIWWFSNDGLVNYLALNIMFVSSVSTIVFNINPLLRYDGYYIMADWLEIPNLRQKATKILTRKCSQWFLGMEQPEDPFLPQRNQFLFALYSIAAFCYRWVVMASILFFIYKVFEPWGLKIIGQLIAGMSIFSLFVMPVYKVVKFFWVPGRIYKVKKARFYLSLSLLLGLVAFLLFCPLPYSVIVPAITELRPVESQAVYIPDVKGGCRLREIDVAPGQTVAKGCRLGLLESRALEREILEFEGRCKSLEMELETLEQLKISRSDAALNMGPLRKSLDAAEKILKQKRRNFDDLSLTAPQNGTVVSPPWKPKQTPQNRGELATWWGSPLEKTNIDSTLEPGTVFCYVGNPAALEAVLVVDQSYREFLAPGQKLKLKLNEFPGLVLTGEVDEIEEQALDTVPVQLTTRAGGDVPTSTQRDGSERPDSAAFRVRFPLDNPEGSIKVGMTGNAKIYVANQTLGRRALRFFNKTFNFKL